MASFRTAFRRARTLLWTAFSIVIISSAVVVGLGKLLMPYSAQYKSTLEAWLSREFERPVELESFNGEWRAFGPQLAVKGLRLLPADDGSGGALIEEAVIDIKPFNALIPSKALYNFRVVGADFQLVHLADGTFAFSGLGVKPGQGGGKSGLKQLASISEVILENSNLRYDDEVHDIHLDLRAINGRLQVRGNELAAEIGFRLAQGAAGRISGELSATALITLDREQHPLYARWKLSVQELMLGQLQEMLPATAYSAQRGRFNTEMWGDWDRLEQHRVRGVVDLRDLLLASDHFERSLERINSRFKWEFEDLDEWRLDLSDFTFEDESSQWTVASLGAGRSMANGAGFWLSADALPVSSPAQIIVDMVRMAGKQWPHYIPAAGEGTVRNFEMVLNREMKLGTATGTIEKGSVSEWDIWPDISNVDGKLKFGPGRQGSLVLNGKDMVVTWPRMFEATLTADMPYCRVDFTWTGNKGQYQVSLPDCGIENQFVSARSKMRFQSNSGKPAVDVVVVADRLDASVVGPYWPRDLLPEAAVAWLENSLLEGELESGMLQIHGDMDEWPFDNSKGRFEAFAQLRDAEIAYFDQWPRARGVDGVARFLNTGMDVSASVEEIGGIPAKQVRARIEDFRNAELRVDYRSETDLPGFLGFVQRTPIREQIGADLSGFAFSGPATTSGTLRVPFGESSGEINLQGQLTLRENVFEIPEFDFALTGITGSVEYSQTGFSAEDLAAVYLGQSSRLAIRAGGESENRFTASLNGAFEVSDILPEHLLESWSPLRQIRGVSDWEAMFVVKGEGESPALSVSSNLEGVEIDLPAPLNKPNGERWPFVINLPLDGEPRILNLSMEDRLGAVVALGDGWTEPGSAAITIGPGEADLPPQGLLSIGGGAETVDLDGWIGLVIEQARQGKSLGGLALESGTLSAGEMVFVDRRFEGVTMDFSTSDGILGAQFDAPNINGKLSFVGAGGGNQSLSAEFERFVLDEPLNTGMQMDIDPGTLPALHLYARSFRYLGTELGETRIEAYPVAGAFHFERVEAESPNMSVRANGDWSLEDGAHRSSFDIHLASESLGDFLRQLDIASPVEGGQTLVDFGVWWDGSPGQFGLARLNGDVNFSVNSGVIRDASPGTGRILGLLSVQSLPRRLALDFRDVFDSGFAFDEANGSFTMLNGSARTDDVVLTSSAANITFSGTTDLVARRYDQLITVRPGLGNTLPVIGAIAGGPGGAAAGFALQGLLGDELGEASQVQYTITGAWDEPLIEPVLKARADG